jgi:hypothetical protein
LFFVACSSSVSSAMMMRSTSVRLGALGTLRRYVL